MRVLTGFQRLDDILLGPAAEAPSRISAQANGGPAIDDLPTAKILRFRLVKRLFLQRDRTRCVATSAMACALYKIGTACDRLVRIAVWIEGDVVGIGCEDLAPDCERPTHGERPGNAGRAVFLHRRHHAFLEISVKRTHIIV